MNKTQRILLINPPWDPTKAYGEALGKMTFVFPPIGLMYLASYIERENNVEVNIYDSQVEDNDIFNKISDFQPDLIGITSQTAQYPIVKSLTEEINKRFPEIKIVIGGSHPSVQYAETASNPYIDISVIGEGEITLSEIIKYMDNKLKLKKIKGIAFLDNKKVVSTPSRDIIPNLNELPMPAIHLIDLSKYRCSPDNQIGKKTAVMTTSRGCPFKCIFCAIKDKYQNKYRVRNIKTIEAELDVYKKNGVDSLFLMDDIFTLNKKAVYLFCDLLEKKQYNFKWWSQTRADCINQEMLLKMKNAGCSIVSFGIESGSDRILKIIKKNVTTKQIKKAVKMARKAGITTRGSFILGLPDETFWESLQTILFGLRLPLHRAKFGLLVPYPGTELWSIALAEGQVKAYGEDWTRFSPMWGYSKQSPSYLPKGRNPFVLGFLQKFANFIFYLKPSVIVDIIYYYHKNKKWNDLMFAVKTFIKATFIGRRAG